MDLFLCPEWGISAPTVSVLCATKNVNFVFNETEHTLCLYRYPTDLPSIECVSLTHVIAKLMSPGTLSLIQSKSGFMWEKLLFCLSSYAGIVCELHNMAKTFSKVGRHF